MVIQKCGLRCYQYAYDTQLYHSFPCNTREADGLNESQKIQIQSGQDGNIVCEWLSVNLISALPVLEVPILTLK